jgi:hypothetical protein
MTDLLVSISTLIDWPKSGGLPLRNVVELAIAVLEDKKNNRCSVIGVGHASFMGPVLSAPRQLSLSWPSRLQVSPEMQFSGRICHTASAALNDDDILRRQITIGILHLVL